ncbi:MAG: hypothetical protein CL868_20720 [Cytophagaceae bacterium]|nr:hypothetical protein [Cytophagaceae bacterium]|tara:strand:- start:2628 stop:3281 length:654 start_codon:yes stop_codon:yes gene_type:complete
MKYVIQIVLWVVIAFLGYLLFNSVYSEVKFDDLKEVRYAKAIDKLIDIRHAQLAHKQVTGKFAKNFEDLEKFIDTAQLVLTQRRDTTILDEEMTKRYRVDQYKEIIITDTLGYKAVKDSLFKGSDRYRELGYVLIQGKEVPFEMDAGTVQKSDIPIPVFEARISKDALLYDQPKDYVSKEKQVVSVDGVNGAYITVGSMTDIKTAGNWPDSYGKSDE